MSLATKIYVDRLQGGHTEQIAEEFDPVLLQIEEQELKFPGKIQVQGEAYLANEHLVICLKIQALALMPCTICNQMVEVPLQIDKLYETVPLNELTSPIYDYQEVLREALLLELPGYIECNGGNCPERKNITGYLKKKPPTEDNSSTHFPFSGLERERFF